MVQFAENKISIENVSFGPFAEDAGGLAIYWQQSDVFDFADGGHRGTGAIDWFKQKKPGTRISQAAPNSAGMYWIGDWEELGFDGYKSFPGNEKLEALGMSARFPDMPDCRVVELESLNHNSEVDWPHDHSMANASSAGVALERTPPFPGGGNRR